MKKLSSHYKSDSENELYKSLFEASHSIMLVIHPDTGEIVDANQSACSFYMYEKETLCNMSIMDINILSQTEILEEMRNAKEEQRNYFLFQHKLANGEIKDVEVYSSPIELGGNKLLYSIIHDISERKRMEKVVSEKTYELQNNRLLMKEMNHRIKNNLIMVQSLLDLQYDNLKDNPSRLVLKDCACRIKTISDIHNILSNNDTLQSIPVSNYIRLLVNDIAKNYSFDKKYVKIDYNIIDISLDVKVLTHLSLLVTELVTNAFKYAFTNMRKGLLFISLKPVTNKNIELIIKDNGPGFPPGFDIDRSGSLGIKIISALVKQISGEIEYNSQKSGMETRILFPENIRLQSI